MNNKNLFFLDRIKNSIQIKKNINSMLNFIFTFVLMTTMPISLISCSSKEDVPVNPVQNSIVIDYPGGTCTVTAKDSEDGEAIDLNKSQTDATPFLSWQLSDDQVVLEYKYRINGGEWISTGLDNFVQISAPLELGENNIELKVIGQENFEYEIKNIIYKVYQPAGVGTVFSTSGGQNRLSKYIKVDNGLFFIGSYVKSGQYQKILLIKYDTDMNVVWSKEYGGNGNSYVRDIIKTSDNKLLLVGTSYATDGIGYGNHGKLDGIVLKIDPETGEIIWNTCIGGAGSDESHLVEEFSDGDYLIINVGNNTVDSTTTLYNAATRLGKSGNMIWQKTILNSILPLTFVPIKLKINSDDSFYLAGSSNNNGYFPDNRGDMDIVLAKYDSTGSYLWGKSFGGSDVDNCQDVKFLDDGNILFSGLTRSNDGDIPGTNHGGNYDIYGLLVDADGNILISKTFGGSSVENGKIIPYTGGYYILGQTNSNDYDVAGNHGENDVWLARLDSNMNIVSQKCFGSDWYNSPITNGYLLPDNSIMFIYSEKGSKVRIASSNSYIYNYKYYITRVAEDGSTIWRTPLLGSSEYDYLYNIEKLDDGNFIAVGYTGPVIESSGWILSWDEDGNLY